MPDLPIDVWPLVAQHLKPRHAWKLLGVSRTANRGVDTEEYWARVALHMVMHGDYGMELDFPPCRRLPDPMKGVHTMRFVTGGYAAAMKFFVNRVRQMLALPIQAVANAGREQFALYADAPLADIVRMYYQYYAELLPDHAEWVKLKALFERAGSEVISMKQRVQLGYEHESSELRIDEDERKLRIRRACDGMLNRIEDDPSIALRSKRMWLAQLSWNVYYKDEQGDRDDWVEQTIARFQPGVYSVGEYHASFWDMCGLNRKRKGPDFATHFGAFLDYLQYKMHALDIPKNDVDALNGIFHDTLNELRGMGRLDCEFFQMTQRVD